MPSNRPSRWLAPLALLAAVVAVLMIYTGTTGDGESEPDNAARTEESDGQRGTSTEREEAETTGRTSTTTQRRTYTVRSGDTLALISERTGVSVEELLELNPRVDPNSLTVGQKIKLTE